MQTDQQLESKRRAIPLVVILLVGFVIASWAMVFSVPRVEKWYDDMNEMPPTLLFWLIDYSKWLGGHLYPSQAIPGVFIVTPIALVLIVAILIRRLAIKRP